MRESRASSDYIQNVRLGQYAGLEGFPTNPNTKRPCIKDPFGRAVNTREEVIDLFKDFPAAGIGIPTGPSNGMLLLISILKMVLMVGSI